MSGDGLRVVDKDTKGLVLDQTIEKVNFILAISRILNPNQKYIFLIKTYFKFVSG